MDVRLIDATRVSQARAEMGSGFVRILGYFKEDGIKSVRAIEDAMRQRNPAALVIPAHTLKGESYQFGAQRLGQMAEEIEMVARRCVEYRESPEELIETVVALRGCFSETIATLESDSSPLVQRRATFGRKADAGPGFGRLSSNG
ncbi:MAG: histidine phosphotransferase [Sphingobium sp.]|jgi:HPt (histidine-containing phosphotransfer) domain-containing protein|nr:MAG: histidine phosphotransferase [Sphingobium sp.]